MKMQFTVIISSFPVNFLSLAFLYQFTFLNSKSWEINLALTSYLNRYELHRTNVHPYKEFKNILGLALAGSLQLPFFSQTFACTTHHNYFIIFSCAFCYPSAACFLALIRERIYNGGVRLL